MNLLLFSFKSEAAETKYLRTVKVKGIFFICDVQWNQVPVPWTPPQNKKSEFHQLEL